MSQGASDWYLRKPFILAVLGTSLSAGRLSGNLWWMRLTEAARAQPEAVGPIVMQNFGKGSQQSTYGVATAPDIALFNPTHVLTEGFAINDCAALPTVISRPDHMANMQTIHDTLKAKNPAVDITWQTMNGVSSAGAALRPALQDYYDDEVTKAAAMGDRMLNHYYGLPTPPAPVGGWPKPLPDYLTDSGDGLHPIWPDALEIYFWPGMIYWLRVRMAEYWGLPIPNPPSPPSPPDAQYLVAAGGGGGGVYVAAGGGAGGRKRGSAFLTNLMGPVLVGFGGAKGTGSSSNSRGNRGFDSALGIGGTGPLQAIGGGGGAGYAISAGTGNGEDGGSGGGSYGPSTPGNGIPGQGNAGGLGQNPNGMAGGGGGVGAVGQGGASGQGGVGLLADWPDAPALTYICGGGPGAQYTLPPQSYPVGGGPANYGGGGRGGDEAASGAYTGEPGGAGTVRVWYAGAVRAIGGTVTTSGGQTIHAFTLADMPVNMTADNAPAGNVTSASTVAASGNYPAWRAFDYLRGYNNDFRGWFTSVGNTTGWLQRRWTGAPKRWLGYAVRGWAGTFNSGAVYAPRDWKIQGSPDGINWTDLDVQAGQTGWADGEVRVFKMNTLIGSYEYYRMLVTANNGGSQLGVDCLVFLPGLEPL